MIIYRKQNHLVYRTSDDPGIGITLKKVLKIA